MAKDKLTLSVDRGFKKNTEQVGQWLLAHGVDVEDKRKGGVSLSATIEVVVAEYLRKIVKGDGATSSKP